jgi:hypothetical protein
MHRPPPADLQAVLITTPVGPLRWVKAVGTKAWTWGKTAVNSQDMVRADAGQNIGLR